MDNKEKDFQTKLWLREQEKQHQSYGGVSSDFVPLWLVRLAVILLPLSAYGYLGERIPQWQETSPIIRDTVIGAAFFSAILYGLTTILLAIFYVVYFRKPRTRGRVWGAALILAALGILFNL